VDYLSELAGAIRDQVDPNRLPDEPVDDLVRSYAVLALTVGPEVTPADVHDAWVAWMIPRSPEHPALLPYDELEPKAAAQDAHFVAAIRSIALARGLGRHASAK
jgi:hypothetical protein